MRTICETTCYPRQKDGQHFSTRGWGVSRLTEASKCSRQRSGRAIHFQHVSWSSPDKSHTVPSKNRCPKLLADSGSANSLWSSKPYDVGGRESCVLIAFQSSSGILGGYEGKTAESCMQVNEALS